MKTKDPMPKEGPRAWLISLCQTGIDVPNVQLELNSNFTVLSVIKDGKVIGTYTALDDCVLWNPATTIH